MTPRATATQNKIKLITIFFFSVLIVLLVQFIRPDRSESSSSEARMFMGLRKASAQEIHAALPETKGRQTLLVFHSRLCGDCRRMAPVLEALMPKHPQLVYRKFDIIEESKKFPAVFRTFKPVSVPMLVFIDTRGNIRNVLYNYQEPATVAAAIAALEKDAVKPANAKKTP